MSREPGNVALVVSDKQPLGRVQRTLSRLLVCAWSKFLDKKT